MEKKLTRFDIVVALGFVLTLSIAVGAFFFGLHTGKEQMDARYQSLIEELSDDRSAEQISYHQQQLVSFYHTVLLPFREFQKTWFQNTNTMQVENSPADSGDLLRQLGRLAREKAAEIRPMSMPEVSPLLREAHEDYLRSLTLFAEATDRMQNEANQAGFAATMKKEPYVLEASSYALRAQMKYYEAIWRWSLDNDPDSSGKDLTAGNNMSMNDWRRLTLNEKNAYISRLLADEEKFMLFYPQDASARIDELDSAGQTGALNVQDVRSLVHTLLSTEAIRYGDYIQSRDKLYSEEKLPQLPFFFDQT